MLTFQLMQHVLHSYHVCSEGWCLKDVVQDHRLHWAEMSITFPYMVTSKSDESINNTLKYSHRNSHVYCYSLALGTCVCIPRRIIFPYMEAMLESFQNRTKFTCGSFMMELLPYNKKQNKFYIPFRYHGCKTDKLLWKVSRKMPAV